MIYFSGQKPRCRRDSAKKLTSKIRGLLTYFSRLSNAEQIENQRINNLNLLHRTGASLQSPPQTTRPACVHGALPAPTQRLLRRCHDIWCSTLFGFTLYRQDEMEHIIVIIAKCTTLFDMCEINASQQLHQSKNILRCNYNHTKYHNNIMSPS